MEMNDDPPAEISDYVKAQLNILNQSSSLINELEVKLDECRKNYQSLLTDATKDLFEHHKRAKTSIEKARPYFTLQSQRKKLISQVQKNAELFNKYQNEFETAKTTLEVCNAESAKFDGSNESKLEEINAAIEKVNSNKHNLRLFQSHHKSLLSQCTALDEEILRAKSTVSGSIRRAQPYFDLQVAYNQKMEEVKQQIESLTQQVISSKFLYSSTMHSLEAISNSIHDSRLHRLTENRRSRGVGADSDSCSLRDVNSATIKPSSRIYHSRGKCHRLSSDLSDPPLCSPRQTPPGQVNSDDDEAMEGFNLHSVDTLKQPLVKSLMEALVICSMDDQFTNDQTSGYTSLIAEPTEMYASFDGCSELRCAAAIPNVAVNVSRHRSL